MLFSKFLSLHVDPLLSISTEEFRDAIVAGATVIDVRTPEEYANGHIDSARLIDWYDASFRERVAALDREKPYLLYCRSAARSASARETMRSMGFVDVRDLKDGVVAWKKAGYPLVR